MTAKISWFGLHVCNILHLIWHRHQIFSERNRNRQYFKRKQDGHDEIGVFQSFLEWTAWVIYRKIVFLIEDSLINFSFHQMLLFRTSDFHSVIQKLCHSRNVYDFKTNITLIKHAWLTDNNKNHSCFKKSTYNGDVTPLPYWWILHTAQLLLSDCHLSENRFYAHSGMPWTVPFQLSIFVPILFSYQNLDLHFS